MRPSGGAVARGDVWLLFPLRPGCHLPLRQDGVRSVSVKQTFAYGHLGWPAQPERRSRLHPGDSRHRKYWKDGEGLKYLSLRFICTFHHWHLWRRGTSIRAGERRNTVNEA